MAKQKRELPDRKRRDRSRDDDSLLLRSAESLGRVIGALQRELERATRRLTTGASTNVGSRMDGHARNTRARGAKKKKKKAAATKKKTAARASKKPRAGVRTTKKAGAARKQTRQR